MGTWTKWIREQLKKTTGSEETRLLIVFSAFVDELQKDNWDDKGILNHVKEEIAQELKGTNETDREGV